MHDKKPPVLMFLSKALYPESRTKQKIQSLVQRGFKVYVLQLDREGRFDNLNVLNRVFVRNITLLRSRSFGKIKYALNAVLFQVIEFLYGAYLVKKYGCLIVHANDFNTLFGAYLLKKVFPNNIMLIYDAYELTPFVYSDWYSENLGKLVYGVETKLVRYVDYILVPSYPVGVYFEIISNDKPIIHLYNFPSSKLIPSVSKQQARAFLNLPRDKVIITYVGSMRVGIALEEFLEAIRLIKKRKLKKKLHFVIIGHGPLSNFVKKFIKENNLEDITTFKSMIPREEIFMYLKASDYSYIILQGENMKIATPWKLSESLACGAIPIVNEGTYAAKLLRKIGTGIIIKNFDPLHLADLFEELGNSTNNYYRHNIDPKVFTWERQEKEFIRVHEEGEVLCRYKKT
ncbi:glycosyltransferase [Thermococcus gorgonarius]|uniref:Glycosyl transferase family 1 domain-containing protein n=1 Tax=Thermococcus gorgonarius TaxID=71997 RepID=A0A2Z2M9X6_THEGO|nr:glycosyltransferase [Thermococcus gorgonarius]ASJ01312.1 hypothetical protein A3K92_07365 [Thermococcus gorgonarius]